MDYHVNRIGIGLMVTVSRLLAALALLSVVAACSMDDLIGEKTPVLTDKIYAQRICNEAGSTSLACYNAKQQVNLRCYRTIGHADCYNEPDPYDVQRTGRTFVRTVDGRPYNFGQPKKKPQPEPVEILAPI